MTYDYWVSELKGHVTNVLGGFATVSSATVASVQPDPFRESSLFVISFVVGVLTIIHVALQIRNLVKGIIKERKHK